MKMVQTFRKISLYLIFLTCNGTYKLKLLLRSHVIICIKQRTRDGHRAKAHLTLEKNLQKQLDHLTSKPTRVSKILLIFSKKLCVNAYKPIFNLLTTKKIYYEAMSVNNQPNFKRPMQKPLDCHSWSLNLLCVNTLSNIG